MKNSIFLIFVLFFSFSFVSCAQNNNDLDNRDIAMVETEEVVKNTNYNDYTNEVPTKRISHKRGTILVDMRSIVEKESNGNIAVVGGYETKTTFVAIAHGKPGTDIERKVFLYYFSKENEILNKKEISQTERLEIIRKLKTL